MAKRATAAVSDDDEPVEKDEAELEGGRMPFLSHLSELRDRVRNAAIFFVLGFLGCWAVADDIFAWLRKPLFDIWAQHTGKNLLPGEADWGPPRLIFTGLTQPFWVNMSVAMWAGIFVSSPFIFYQLWKFIAPGLYKRERKLTVVFAASSALLFAAGALFCFYLALPALFRYMLHYNSEALQSLPNIQDYLDLTRDSMLAFGAIFEMPLLIFFLALVGLVTHRTLWKFSRWFVVLAFVIGAVLTPGPDVVSQFLMATPMIVLYNISILLARSVTLKRERREAAQKAREAASDARRRAAKAAASEDEAGADDE
jgi:sec-independent protein translocase protein TatC